MAFGVECAVHNHRDFIPQESHHVWPLGDGGPNVKGNRLLVCSNGHSEIHGYLDLLIKYKGEVPGRVAAHFGDRVRKAAQLGYAQMVAAGAPRIDHA